jgi:hypothetical protein
MPTTHAQSRPFSTTRLVFFRENEANNLTKRRASVGVQLSGSLQKNERR